MAGNAVRQTNPARPAWRPPLGPERYDRRPLSLAERAALAALAEGPLDGPSATDGPARRAAEAILSRLVRPLHEVYALRRRDASRRALAAHLLFRQMHRRGRAFWQWSAQDWHDVVGATAAAFEAANGRGRGCQGLRPHLLDVAYLLCGFDAFGPLWLATAFSPMARVV
jgi:hypothetical protein